MLKLAIVALVCARALALPAAPDTALTPPDLERTSGPKCCECGADSPTIFKEYSMLHKHLYKKLPCKAQAKVKPKLMWWDKPGKKESCEATCKPFGGYFKWKMHYDCRAFVGFPDGEDIKDVWILDGWPGMGRIYHTDRDERFCE